MHPLLCFLILTVLCAIVENILYKQEEHLFWNKDAQQYVLLCVGKAMNFHSRSSKSTSKNRRRSKTTTITITWAIAVHPFMNLFWCSHPVDYHPYSLVHPTIQNFIWNKKKCRQKCIANAMGSTRTQNLRNKNIILNLKPLEKYSLSRIKSNKIVHSLHLKIFKLLWVSKIWY